MPRILSRIKNGAMRRMKQRKARRYVASSLRLLHGPPVTFLEGDQIALVIVARDMGYFLDHHIRHHLDLGVSHIVYVDNGSTDDSIEIVKRFDNVTIASCSANFRFHENRIRYLANTHFLRGGWRLAIDPDELLDYPGSHRIDLPELTRRMNARGHTALVAQMLDMVFDGPLSHSDTLDFPEAERAFDKFSLTNIEEDPYHGSDSKLSWFLEKNSISNGDIKILFGGIRNAVFGEDCCLTKHALFKVSKGVVPHPHPHITTGVACADFSAVLKHYKFCGAVLNRERRLLDENRVAHGETKKRIETLEMTGDVNLADYAECHGFDIGTLVAENFLVVSAEAKRYLL